MLGRGVWARHGASWWGERGVTGIEVAIVLIAFVVVASVFAFTVLQTGLVSTEQSKETILGGLDEAAASLVLRGSVIANKTSGSDTVESVLFQVSSSSRGGTDVDLSRSGTSSTLITYIDKDQVTNLGQGDWLVTWLIGSGDLLSPGERAEIRVTLSGLSPALNASKDFTIQVKPIIGGVMVINRITPAELKTVMDLY